MGSGVLSQSGYHGPSIGTMGCRCAWTEFFYLVRVRMRGWSLQLRLGCDGCVNAMGSDGDRSKNLDVRE